MSAEEEQRIVDVFNNKEQVGDLSVAVSYADIKKKNYSLSAGQYFEVKIEYIDITAENFDGKMQIFTNNLNDLFKQSHKLEMEIEKQLSGLKYEYK